MSEQHSGIPAGWAPAQILALSDQRDAERARTEALIRFHTRLAWQTALAACRLYHDELAGHDAQVRDAYAAGRRDMAQELGRGQAHQAGWDTAMIRFADLIGGRIHTPRPTEHDLRSWTRHSPRCVHGGHGGRYYCKRAGCIPGPRQDYGKRAPWEVDTAERDRLVAASWAALAAEGELAAEAAVA